MATSTCTPSTSDPYVLGRDIGATARLNAQHHIWKDQVGYLVHPSISLEGDDLAIADVGTGTGIWLLDVARGLSSSTQLDGFDISLDQCPPIAWLAPNIRFKQLDILGDIPSDLHGAYDMVHVRYMILVVQNDPTPMLRNLLKMLKPGGYLQWSEPNLHGRILVKSNPSNPSENLMQLQREIEKTPHSSHTSWPAHLDEIFKEEGMLNVLTHSQWTQDTHLSVVQANALAVHQELISRMQGERAEHLHKLLNGATAECRAGVAWNIQRCVTVGQKPNVSECAIGSYGLSSFGG